MKFFNISISRSWDSYVDYKKTILIEAPNFQLAILRGKINQPDGQYPHRGSGKVIVSISCGIALIFCGIILDIYKDVAFVGDDHTEYNRWLAYGGEACRDFGIALIIAGAVAFLIEIPTLIQFVRDRLIEALKNNNYLSSLSDDDLKDVKQDCNRLIFDKSGKRPDLYLNDSLFNFENQVFDLLMKPYYEYFRVHAYVEDDHHEVNTVRRKFQKKTVTTSFKLVNPVISRVTDDKGFTPVNFYCPDGFDSKKLLKLVSLRIRKDGEKDFEDFADKVECHIVSDSNKHPKYNTRINYKFKNSERAHLEFDFERELIVEMVEERLVCDTDPIFTKRINRPAKSFVMNYVHASNKIVLKGDCFGSLASVGHGININENGNTVYVECFKWLLPGNGIYIAIVPDETN